MFNRKYLVVFLALLFACMSVAVAADVDDSTADATVTIDDAPTGISNVQEQTTVSEDNIIKKESKNLKEDTTPIEVTNTTFDNYFENSYLKSSVAEGSVLDFKGLFEGSTYKMTIDKAVNITSSDNSAIIDLDTVGNSYFGDDPGDAFTIDSTSYVNVSNIKFHNTQLFVKGSQHIVLDNINVTVENQQIGSGVGVTSIRDGSFNVTVGNSVFYTENNGGSSTLVLAGADNCTIENNTITGVGQVGNLLYLTTYNIYNVEVIDANTNSYNVIRNNTINGPTSSAICYAIALTGHDNLVDSNTINYAGQAITTQWLSPTNNEQGDNDERYLGNNYTNNIINNDGSFKASTNSTITGNSISGDMTIVTNNTVNDNNIEGITSVTGSNSNITGNNFYDSVRFKSGATSNNFTYNNVDGDIKLKTGANYNTVTYNNYTGGIDNVGTGNTDSPNYQVSSISSNNNLNSILSSNDKYLKGDENILVLTSDNYETYCTIDETAEGYIYIDGFKKKKIPYTWSGTIYFNDTLSNKLCGIRYGARKNCIVTANPDITFRNVIFNTGNQAPAVDNVTLTNISIKINNNILGTGILDEWAMGRPAILKNPSTKNVVWDNVTLVAEFDSEYFENYPMDAVRIETGLTIKNCHFNITGYSSTVDWEEGSSNYGRNNFMAIYQVDFNNMMGYTINEGNFTSEELNTYLINNTFIINSDDTVGGYPTLYGIHINRENTTITGNNITFTAGEGWNYAIDAQANNVTINDNVISVSGINYTAGIGLENPTNNIINNNTIYVNSSMDEQVYDGASNEYCAYAIFMNDFSYQGGKLTPSISLSYNNTISNNHIIGNAYNTYAIEAYGGTDNAYLNNTIEINATTAMGIGAIAHNATIANNIITINGTSLTASTVDYLGAMTTGVFLARAGNNTVYDNNINSTKYGMYIAVEDNDLIENNTVTTDYENAIYLQRSNNSFVKNNYLVSQELKGDNAVIDNKGSGNTIENNKPSDDTPKYDTTIQFEADDEYDASEDMPINGYLVYMDENLDKQPLSGADVTITVTFNDSTNITNTTQTDEGGCFDLTIESSRLLSGQATIKIEYAGDDNYNSVTEQFTTTITAAEPKIPTTIKTKLPVSTLELGEDVSITVTFYKCDEIVYVYEDGIQISNISFASRNKQTYRYIPTTVGNHTLKFEFNGNQTHEGCYVENTIEVKPFTPKQSKINLLVNNNSETEVGQEIRINGWFSVISGTHFDHMTVYVDGIENTTIEPYTEWGSFEYNYTPQTPGSHEIKFTYAGNNTVLPSEAYITIIATEAPKEYSLKVDSTEFVPGTNATIQASIYYGNEFTEDIATDINKGKISFKVDGKTLKDANGKVIYAKVVNGTAKIENYPVPDTWTNKTVIQAIYTGSADLEKMTSEKTAITISAREPTITTEDVSAAVGSKVTLTATINTDATINTGKVVFKINGKTVKDENGKVIYAKVSDNQVSVEYTIPADMKTGTYNLTAVFLSPDYDRLEDTKTLTVTA